MSTTSDATAVRSSVVVEAPIERAFTVFTEGIGSWWDKDHHILEGELAEMVFEPRVGGHVMDRGTDGSECRWARVLAYDPPHRLLLAWNISPHWQLETDPDHASEIEVTFTALDDGHTRVDLEHRHLERHGDGWHDLRGGLEAPDGWPLYLDRYATLTAER